MMLWFAVSISPFRISNSSWSEKSFALICFTSPIILIMQVILSRNACSHTFSALITGRWWQTTSHRKFHGLLTAPETFCVSSAGSSQFISSPEVPAWIGTPRSIGFFDKDKGQKSIHRRNARSLHRSHTSSSLDVLGISQSWSEVHRSFEMDFPMDLRVFCWFVHNVWRKLWNYDQIKQLFQNTPHAWYQTKRYIFSPSESPSITSI